MVLPGEIYLADIPPGQWHHVVVVSREELNRGDYVVAALITSHRFAIRSKLANCVPLLAREFGMTQDCVIQAEMAGPIHKDLLDLASGPTGQLDDLTLRDLIKAVGYVIDSDCEPN